MPRLTLPTTAILYLFFNGSEVNSAENLSTNTTKLEETVIIGSDDSDKTTMDLETTRLLGVAGAANDPLKAIYAFSSVTFSGGFSVNDPVIRGSAPNDNAYYIDGIPARYIFHVFGTSIFNKHLIHRFDFFPAAFSSQYHDATGGIIDVTLRDPEDKPLTATLNWSFLNTGLLIESRIAENMAFYAAYRKSLLREYDQLVDLKSKSEMDGFTVTALPADQDYQFKYQWHLSSQHQITLSANGANDDLGAIFETGNNLVERDPDFAGAAKINKGFDNQSVEWLWKSTSGNRSIAMNVSHLSDYNNSVYGRNQYQRLSSDGYRFSLKGYQRFSPSHRVTWGANYETTEYTFNLDAKIPTCNPNLAAECPTVDATRIQGNRSLRVRNPVMYLTGDFLVNKQHLLTLGLQLTHNSYLHETRLEPRLRWTYLINDRWQMYTAAGQYSQSPELLQILDITGNPDLVTEKSNHYLLGAEHQFGAGYSITAEAYVKTMTSLVASGVPPLATTYSNDARGTAYGFDLLLKKTLTDQWYGWISLALSKTQRKNTLTGLETPFKFDKPVILNIVSNYLLSDRWTFAVKWNYQTGGMYTPVINVQPNTTFPDILDPVYGPLNSERLPDFHQLDIRIEYKRPKNWGYWTFYIDILDATNQKNITGYRYAPNKKDTIKPPKGFGKNVPVTASRSLGLIPSLGFEIQF